MVNEYLGFLIPVMGALSGMFLLIFFVLYVYLAFALMTIAKKTKTANAWLAWIPIANLYLMTQIAGVPWWTFLIAIAAGFVPFIGGFVMSALVIWWWWKIAEARKKPGWISLLLLLPIVNFIVIGVIAWSD